MIILAALLISTPQTLEDPDQDYPEIVVLAERLDQVTVTAGRDKRGKWHCSMDKSSGVPRLDQGLCKAVVKCARKNGLESAAVKTCVTASKGALITQFKKEMADRR